METHLHHFLQTEERKCSVMQHRTNVFHLLDQMNLQEELEKNTAKKKTNAQNALDVFHVWLLFCWHFSSVLINMETKLKLWLLVDFLPLSLHLPSSYSKPSSLIYFFIFFILSVLWSIYHQFLHDLLKAYFSPFIEVRKPMHMSNILGFMIKADRHRWTFTWQWLPHYHG